MEGRVEGGEASRSWKQRAGVFGAHASRDAKHALAGRG